MMNNRNFLALPMTALALAFAAQPVQAEKGDWMRHLRAIEIAPEMILSLLKMQMK